MRFQFGAPTPATLKERKLPKNRLEPIVRFIRGLGFHGRHPGDLAFHPPLLCFVSKLILTPCVSGVNRTSPLRIKVHALFIFERLRSGNVYQSHVTVEGGPFPTAIEPRITRKPEKPITKMGARSVIVLITAKVTPFQRVGCSALSKKWGL